MYARYFALLGFGLLIGLTACDDNTDPTPPSPPIDNPPAPGCSDNSACDDGLFCNGAEVCDMALGRCMPGAPPPLDDGVACTVDACDEERGMVVHMPDNGPCDDGQFCNGAEVCDLAIGCVAGVAPSFDDGQACTDEVCDEETDGFISTPNDANCDDGRFCNGSETCDAALGCVAGVAPVVDDGIACTDDVCDEESDLVLNTPNNATCDDGRFCNGAEVCQLALGCVAGDPVLVNDDIACTVDVCDEVNDQVFNTPDDSVCDNGNLCDGVEFCDSLSDCQAGTVPTSELVGATQSTDTQTIVQANGVACGTAGIHTENSYYRVFDFANLGFACDFAVTSVDIGIELANAGGDFTEQPMVLKLYRLNGDFSLRNLTELATVNVSVSDQTETILNVPVAVTASTRDLMVVEVLLPNGQDVGHSLFIGTNSAGQSAPSFIRAPACGVTEPTDVANMGFPNMHLVMTINGATVDQR